MVLEAGKDAEEGEQEAVDAGVCHQVGEEEESGRVEAVVVDDDLDGVDEQEEGTKEDEHIAALRNEGGRGEEGHVRAVGEGLARVDVREDEGKEEQEEAGGGEKGVVGFRLVLDGIGGRFVEQSEEVGDRVR